MSTIEYASSVTGKTISAKVHFILENAKRNNNDFFLLLQIFISFYGCTANKSFGQTGMVFHPDSDVGKR